MDTYKQVSEVNLWGTIRVTKAVLPLIRRAKGQLRLVKQCPTLRQTFWEFLMPKLVSTEMNSDVWQLINSHCVHAYAQVVS